MSERGSFVTQYCYCEKCFEGLKKILVSTDKYLCSTVPPSWCNQEIPVIGGKIGGLYDGEEIHQFDVNMRERIENALCKGHTITIAVMADGGQNEFIFAQPQAAGGTKLELNSNTTGGYQRINAAQTAIDFDLQYGGTTKLKIDSQGVTVENGVAVSTTLTDTSNSGSVTLNFDSYQNFILTLTGNVTLANPSTENAGQTGFIIFIQDGTGGRTVSLGTDYETAGGAGLTLSSAASAVDIVPYVTQSASNILLGTPQKAFS